MEFREDIDSEKMYFEEGIIRDIQEGRVHLQSILLNQCDVNDIQNAINLLEEFEHNVTKHKDFGGYN